MRESFRARRLLTEGGNAIKNAKSIHQWEVLSTIADLFETLLPALGVAEQDAALIGSAGKKLPEHDSGDLDIVISAKAASRHCGSVEAARERIKELWKKKGLETNWIPVFDLLSVAWPIKGRDGDLVQVDIFFAKSMKYVEWAMYSPSELDSSYKSAVRNQLITQTVTTRSRQVLSPYEYDAELYNLRDGLLSVHVSFVDSFGKVVRDPITTVLDVVSDDPEYIAEKYFNTSADNLDSAESVLAIIKDDEDFPEIAYPIVSNCSIKRSIPLPIEIYEAARAFEEDVMSEVLYTPTDQLTDELALLKREHISGVAQELDWKRRKASEQ